MIIYWISKPSGGRLNYPDGFHAAVTLPVLYRRTADWQI